LAVITKWGSIRVLMAIFKPIQITNSINYVALFLTFIIMSIIGLIMTGVTISLSNNVQSSQMMPQKMIKMIKMSRAFSPQDLQLKTFHLNWGIRMKNPIRNKVKNKISKKSLKIPLNITKKSKTRLQRL